MLGHAAANLVRCSPLSAISVCEGTHLISYTISFTLYGQGVTDYCVIMILLCDSMQRQACVRYVGEVCCTVRYLFKRTPHFTAPRPFL
jgi:hypothetical protein